MMWVFFWVYVAIAMPWGLCAAAYGFRSPWWRSWIGRALLATCGTLFVALALTPTFQVIHLPYVVAAAIALVVLGAIGLIGCALLVTILRIQRLDRREAAPTGEDR